MANGKLIVIEGACDGIGKSTQFDLLKKHLRKDGLEIASHHFPTYDSEQGLLVQKYLKGEFGRPEDLSAYFINSLYAIDRAITWQTKLRSLYESGSIILLDRYTTSSLFYQSALIESIEEKKKFIDYVSNFEYQKLGIKEPDIIIFLDASFNVIMKYKENRTENEGIKKDIHEVNKEFLRKVYENSQFVANYLGWAKIACDKNEDMRNREEIHEDIYKLVKEKINKGKE